MAARNEPYINTVSDGPFRKPSGILTHNRLIKGSLNDRVCKLQPDNALSRSDKAMDVRWVRLVDTDLRRGSRMRDVTAVGARR